MLHHHFHQTPRVYSRVYDQSVENPLLWEQSWLINLLGLTWCPGKDSILPYLAATGTSSKHVYPFRHLGRCASVRGLQHSRVRLVHASLCVFCHAPAFIPHHTMNTTESLF